MASGNRHFEILQLLPSPASFFAASISQRFACPSKGVTTGFAIAGAGLAKLFVTIQESRKCVLNARADVEREDQEREARPAFELGMLEAMQHPLGGLDLSWVAHGHLTSCQSIEFRPIPLLRQVAYSRARKSSRLRHRHSSCSRVRTKCTSVHQEPFLDSSSRSFNSASSFGGGVLTAFLTASFQSASIFRRSGSGPYCFGCLCFFCTLCHLLVERVQRKQVLA